MRYIDGVPVWGESADEGALRQIKICSEAGAVAVALMADHHRGYSAPIGGVLAFRGAISPSGVGYDIACGNKAVRLDLTGEQVLPRLPELMDRIYAELSFGIGRKNAERVEHEVLDSPAWDMMPDMPLREGSLRDLAANQLGTIGSGNHYVDLFLDEHDRAWIGVHFGSRGLGHRLASYFIKAGGGRDGEFVPPVVLPVESDLGEQYLLAMGLAGMYAYAGRDWVCSKVASILGGEVVEEVHNHHNYAWKELHTIDGETMEEVYVVRKGATPAWPGQRGFVGGSMGDLSAIVSGRQGEGRENDAALWSTVHGAGRVMSRTRAAGKWRYKGGQRVQVSEGEISRRMMAEWLLSAAERHGVPIELRGAGTDESPHCYKRLPEVLAAHGDTIQVDHWLRPIGVAMAGSDELDPYKD